MASVEHTESVQEPTVSELQNTVAEDIVQAELIQMHIADVTATAGIATRPLLEKILKVRFVKIAQRRGNEMTPAHGAVPGAALAQPRHLEPPCASADRRVHPAQSAS